MQTLSSFCEAWFYKAILSACGATLFVLIGENYIAYQIFFILTSIDFITGVMVGFFASELSSRKMFRTSYKFLIYSLLAISAHQMTRYSGHFEWVEDGVVLFVASTELLSIIENTHKLGVPMPMWIKKRLLSIIENGNLTEAK